MKRHIKQLGVIITVFFLTLLNIGIQVFGATVDHGSTYLDSFELYKIDKTTSEQTKINENDLMFDNDDIKVVYQFSMPNGHTIIPGDTSTIKIPEGLRIHYLQTIPLLDAKGNHIATATAKPEGNEISIEYLDKINKVNDIVGEINFRTAWNQFAFGSSPILPGTIMDALLEMPVHNTNQPFPLQQQWQVYNSEYDAAKFSAILSETPTQRIIKWRLYVNKWDVPRIHENVNIIDKIGINQIYNYDISVKTFPEITTVDPSLYSIVESDTGFQIQFNQTVDYAIRIEYTVTTTDGNISDKYYNDYTLKSSLVDTTVRAVTNSLGNGGNVNSNVALAYITKQDSKSKQPLSNAIFDLYDSTDTIVSSHLTTDANGFVGLPELLYGNYYLKEIQAPTGYKLRTDNINFSVDVSNKEFAKQIIVTNELKDAQAYVTKKDSKTNALLSGAVFDLFDDANNSIATNLTTDVNGNVTLPELPFGNYYLKETQAPAGYKLVQNNISFSVDASNVDVSKEVVVLNDLKGGQSFITKKDSKTNQPLSGAIFDLFDDANNVVATNLTTDVNGHVALPELPFGNYQLKETQAPAGYRLLTTNITFTLDASNVDVAKEIIVLNDVKDAQAYIAKKDSKTNQPLSGAIFDLFDDANNVIATNLTTDANGQVNLPELQFGNYRLVETKAPAGYILSTDSIKFSVDINNTEVAKEIVVLNEAIVMTAVEEPKSTVNNTEGKLAETGQTEMSLSLFVGLGIMLSSMSLLIFNRKRV